MKKTIYMRILELLLGKKLEDIFDLKSLVKQEEDEKLRAIQEKLRQEQYEQERNRLHAKEIEKYGSWENYLEKSGIKKHHIKRKFTDDDVKEIIRNSTKK